MSVFLKVNQHDFVWQYISFGCCRCFSVNVLA